MKYKILSLGEEKNDVPKEESHSFFKSPFPKSDTNVVQDVLRTGARVGETLGGIPGNVLSTGLGVGSYLSSGKIPTYEKIQEKLPLSLPTTSQLRQTTKKFTGEYLEPKNEEQRFVDDIVSDIASFSVPILGKAPTLKTAGKLALGGNVVKQIAKFAGFDEGVQEASKIGFSFLSGIPGTRNKIEAGMKTSYDRARAVVGNKNVAPTKFYDDIVKILDSTQGVKTAAREFIQDKITPLAAAINRVSTPISKIWDEKIQLNGLLRDPRTPKGAIPAIKRLVGSANELLYSLGKDHPEFVANFTVAEDINRGLNKASEINRFFQRNGNLLDLLKNTNLKNFWKLSYAAPLSAGFKIAGSVPKTAEFIFNSKAAKAVYKNVLKAAAENNVGLASKSMAKLNSIFEKI